MFIDGQWVDSDTKKTFETLNPENNKPWAVVPEASANDVDRAVKAAQKAFEGEWPKMLARDRAKYLRAIGNKLRENSELLGKIETIDTGKLYRETYQQAKYIAEYYDYYAGLADKVEGTVLPIDKPNIQAITTRIPIGVIAAIIPWNSQMFLTATKVAPALAMGNTVVIKCSELAPATMFEFAKLVEETGLPKGVVNVVSGFGDPCGKALTTHNLVEKVAFTGGPETARHIIRNSAENLSEVSLELGGKSPVAVFDDAEQENAINGITVKHLRELFPKGAKDLVKFYHLYEDNIFLKIFREIDLSNLSHFKKIELALFKRFEVIIKNKEAFRRSMAFYSLPFNQIEGLNLVFSTCDKIWVEIGDRSYSYDWYTKRILLASIYLSSLLFLFGDNSTNHSETYRFITSRLDELKVIGKLKFNYKDLLDYFNLIKFKNSKN